MYPTDFGQVDILCVGRNGIFIIIEILTDRFPDASSGQILKHRAWVKRHLSFGKPVRSYLVGASIPEHVRYSLSDQDGVFLKEYDLSIRLKDVPKISELELNTLTI
jgi:RecB family endonuclease NucS